MLPELRKKWERESCIGAPAAASEITVFERERNVQLPADFRKYLYEFNGTAVDGDSNLFEFYPLHKLTTWREANWPGPPKPPAGLSEDELYVFANYMISSWAYAILLDESAQGGSVLSFGFPRDEVIASTFTEFIFMYLADDPRIYPSAPNTLAAASKLKRRFFWNR